MLQINDAFSTDFEEIDIDPFWNVGNEAEHKNHRIHTYPAKFPAFITQKAIQYAQSEGITVNCIADIFCGCGTVAFEAKRLDIDFWGCDLNPTAVLIAKAKSSNYDNVTTQKYFDTIIRKFDDGYSSYSTPQIFILLVLSIKNRLSPVIFWSGVSGLAGQTIGHIGPEDASEIFQVDKQGHLISTIQVQGDAARGGLTWAGITFGLLAERE